MFLSLIVALLISTVANVASAAADTFVFGGDHDYPPYEFLDKKGKPAGFHVDLARAIGETMGFEVSFRFGPWRNVKQDLYDGKVDAVPMVRTPERDKDLDFAVPHGILSHEFFVRRNESTCDPDKGLEGKEVIAQSGAITQDYLLGLGLSKYVVLVGTEAEAMRLLASGRHDCALVTDMGGRIMIQRHGLSNLTSTGPPLLSGKYCFAVREDNDELRNLISEGLAELKVTGRFEEIHEKWLAEPWSHRLGEYLKSALILVAVVVSLLLLFILWSWSLRRKVADRTAQLQKEIGERLRLEEQLRFSQKMEAIGQLAGGVAHDFNNLLGGILGYASVLKRETEHGSKAHEAAGTIEKAAQNAADLTKQLLGFARRGKFRSVSVDMHQLVREVVSLLERSLDKNIEIELDLEARRFSVKGDPGQLQQVLLNLAINARDAMPEGGHLSIGTSELDIDGFHPKWGSRVVPDRYVSITVSDTGHGIPPDIIDRIFEPFFTTKGHGAGTGMGLATVYGIADNHGGSISVEAEDGHGSTFEVVLPLCDDDTGDCEDTPPGSPASTTARILVVDDQEIMRKTTADMLRHLGYDVVAVASGDDAVDHLAAHADEIDMVLLDMTMPGMSGSDCFSRLREIDADVRVVLSTGYGHQGKAQEIMDKGMKGFVQKPYDLDTLSAVIEKALKA